MTTPPVKALPMTSRSWSWGSRVCRRSAVLRAAALVAGAAGVVSSALTITGCGRKDELDTPVAEAGAAVPTRASCDRVQSASVCSEYTGSYLARSEPALSASCVKLGGTFVRAACPNTSLLGSCTLPTSERRHFYASGAAGYDAARATTECQTAFSGTWARFE